MESGITGSAVRRAERGAAGMAEPGQANFSGNSASPTSADDDFWEAWRQLV
jgi:hypothetical protein